MASLQISFLPCNTDRWWSISCELREASGTGDRSVNSYMASCMRNIGLTATALTQILSEWASCQIRELRVADAPGIPGTFSPPPRVSDPDMHHGMCVTHVPWCMSRSLTSGFVWSRWRVKRSRHSRRMCHPQFFVSGKRPMLWQNSPAWIDTTVIITKSIRFHWIYPKITVMLCPVSLIIVSYLGHSYVFFVYSNLQCCFTGIGTIV